MKQLRMGVPATAPAPLPATAKPVVIAVTAQAAAPPRAKLPRMPTADDTAKKPVPSKGRALDAIAKSVESAQRDTKAEKHNLRVLLNSLKARAPLYRAAVEFDGGAPEEASAALFAGLKKVVDEVMTRCGVEPSADGSEWIKASLSGTMAPLVAAEWRAHREIDVERLVSLALTLAGEDLSAAPQIYAERTNQVALAFSRSAAIANAQRAMLRALPALQFACPQVAAEIDAAVATGHTALRAALKDQQVIEFSGDDIIMRQALYREAGEWLSVQLDAHAGKLRSNLVRMTPEDRRVYLHNNGGRLPIEPAFVAFRGNYSDMVETIASGFSVVPAAFCGVDTHDTLNQPLAQSDAHVSAVAATAPVARGNVTPLRLHRFGGPSPADQDDGPST